MPDRDLSSIANIGDPASHGESSAETEAPRLALARRSGSLWAVLALVLCGVAAFIVAAESLSLVRHAQRAQASLEAFKAHLQQNDDGAARRDLSAAAAELAAAQRRYNSPVLGFVRHVPLLGWPISDSGHLLAAATDVQSAGTDALGLYEQVHGPRSKLFQNETVSLRELRVISADAAQMVRKMDSAVAQLHSLHAAFWEPSVGRVRGKALRQVASVRAEGDTAERILRLAPGIVGANGPRTYLVVVLNPAELEGAGGAALNFTAMRFDNGAMKMIKNGATSDLASQVTPFKPLAIDPWLQGLRAQFLGAVDRSPDFRTSGAELMRGFTAAFHIRISGIIALDPVALQGLMTQIPPFATPGYGRVSASNIVQTLLVDSYAKFQVPIVRHKYNVALMQTLLHQVLGGGHLLSKAQALRTAAAAGHLQVLMDDPRVQQAVASAGLLRTLPDPGRGDVMGVYTTNHNASKVDVWQHRWITQQVTVHADGSVDAVRTVQITNAAPPYARPGKDPGIGYWTRISAPLMTMYVPANATVESFSQDGRRVVASRFLERGLGVLQMQQFWLPQGASTTVILRYSLPPGTVRGGNYVVSVAAQPTVVPAPLTIQVVGSGSCVSQGAGWTTAGAGAVYRAPQTSMFNATVACQT